METPELKDVLERNAAVLISLERCLAQDGERGAALGQQVGSQLDEFKTYIAMCFEHMEARLDEQRADLKAFRNRIEDRLDALSRWGIGLLVAVVVTVLGAVIRGWH